MESYPEDLLVGVSPLVFAVNALDAGNSEDSSSETDSGAAASPKNRSDFDRFLDAMAGSLVDEIDDEAAGRNNNEPLEFQPTLPPSEGPSGGRNHSLFRPDDDDDESTDDEFLFELEDDETNISSGRRQNSIRLGFGLNRRGSANPSNANNTSYAKALQHGQGFFQKARIVSISTKHGFPPSKDPQGTESIAYALKQARTSPQKAKELFTRRPIQGILGAGWLEKHVYALPSVVLVVAKLSKVNQESQDSYLLKTVENLQYSLVPKRPCKIHVVCLVEDDVAIDKAEQWSLKISRRIVGNPNTQPYQQEAHQMTLLRAGKDLRSGTDGFPTSVALRRLHRTVRDSSLAYYLGLTRRTKDKLAELSEVGSKKRRLSTAKPPRLQPRKELLPLAIRYCFKISMYYEFQMKFEKAIRFMAEAYRHCRVYYHHLVRISVDHNSDEDEDGRVSPDPYSSDANNNNAMTPTKSISNVSISTETDDTEVTIADSSPGQNSGSDDNWVSGLPPPPDAIHQCLAVADWLNFKLLQAGFGSHTEGGLLAAAAQWRRHSRVFCTRRFLGGHAIMSEDWLFWCHVARQRLVMGQLVERHPPKALGDFGNEYDEVLLRCAPWRAYEAAAEAYLQAGVSVQNAMKKTSQSQTLDLKGEKDDNRAPFVGGLDEEGLVPLLEKESKIDHKEKALELVSRAISLFEHEWGKEKLKDAEDQFPHRTWGRFGARLYYLAGGILVGKARYGEARTRLELCLEHAREWDGIEFATRRLLTECYKNDTPTLQDDGSESSQKLVANVMESCFNSNLSPATLLGTLSKCGSMCSTDLIKWNCECYDEFDSRLPFAFSVTYPGKSHATCGDKVVVSVRLQSNLDYTVQVSSVTLLSLAGPIQANVGSLTVPRKEEVVFSAEIELPTNLDDIASEEEEKKGGTGKNSFAKSARPRTAGITSAAGGRLVSEKLFGSRLPNSNAQWSLSFLGGKPMRCDGIRLVISPHESTSGSSAAGEFKPIEVTIEKKKAKPAANKRTPFEEDNYIASVWARPLHLPLPIGPRCLRVLGPMSEMEITNLTLSASGGRAVEGTVNRVCLKLQAGPNEMCSEISFKVKFSSTLVTAEGATRNLITEDTGEENTIYMKNPSARTPVLVTIDPLSKHAHSTDFGYDLPPGWIINGTGQEGDGREPQFGSSLKSEECTYIFFELFRPSAITAGKIAGADESWEEPGFPSDICQTDFEVSVSYRQKRQQPEQGTVGDPKPSADSKISKFVSQTFSGSVNWIAPVKANFYRGIRSAFPSGSRHPSNLTDDARPSDTSIFTNVTMIDGERVSMRTALQGDTRENGFDFEVLKIRFEGGDKAESPCDLVAASPDGVLYHADKDDPCRWLKASSKFTFVYNVQANMKNKNRSATFPLGVILIDWLPRPIELPSEVQSESIKTHGPLALSTPLTVKFLGPPCYIEKAPFRATFKCSPSVPKVSVPFEVNYCIANETNSHQRITVSLNDNPSPDSHEILVCGLMNGDIRLAPFESQTFSYTAISTKPGLCRLPGVHMSSSRYNSMVVNDVENARPLCILP